eukprot:gnl/TRDRNA2_/TRDRNA2_185862_c0_seq1.p1 gnl/TRDRNA2_/TRDRNA2_185862_c0~~gnl/TRDRNA2_/TRDRNA2_185862_c0_seq1.p1  ORF type:complete len:281 (-),score=40.28 gnl/TRDRNA2_/TRDRNA2_185862_c0_seq1:127-969(-)
MATCCPPGSAPYLAADHTDEGSVAEAEGVQYYQVGSGAVGLLMLPDVWGWNGGRTRALADDFAKKGFNVFVPKLLPPFEGGTDGDGLPPTFDVTVRGGELGPQFKGPWSAQENLPKMQKVVAAMRTAGVKKFGALGFCYGAWVGFHLSSTISGDEFVCGVSAHPSVHIEGMMGNKPADLAAKCNCPWALYPCGAPGSPGSDGPLYDKDGDLFQALEARFPGKNHTKRYETMRHGFVSRGAIKDGQFKAGDGDAVKAAVQECTEDILRFFQERGLVEASKM